MAWEYEKRQVRSGAVTYRFGFTTVPGTHCMEATIASMAMPLGFIWYRFASGKTVEIAYIWTHEDVRRCGLATKMLENLLNSYGEGSIRFVSTGQVNEFSKPWCLKNGFRYNKQLNYWLREMPKPKRKKKI